VWHPRVSLSGNSVCTSDPVMDAFHRSLASIAHVLEKHAPYYVGWVRQAYDLAEATVGAPLSPEAEQQALLQLQGRCQD